MHYTISFIAVMMFPASIFIAYRLLLKSEYWQKSSEEKRKKGLSKFIPIMISQFFGVMVVAATSLAFAPGTMVAQEEVVESFMKEWSDGNVDEAFTYLIDSPDEDRVEGYYVFRNRPLEWEFPQFNENLDVFNGTVTFTDDEVVNLSVGLSWQWRKLSWGISLVHTGFSSNHEDLNAIALSSTLTRAQNQFLVWVGLLWSVLSAFLFVRKARRFH